LNFPPEEIFAQWAEKVQTIDSMAFIHWPSIAPIEKPNFSPARPCRKMECVELRHLRYFLAVADAAHFTRAAQKLYVSQPTLSQQIKQLEDELGTPLFHRGAGGVQLTVAGERFRPYAERVLHEMDEAVSALGQSEVAPALPLRIGALEGTGDYLLPSVVARAVEKSGLQIEVETLPALELQRAVAREELDLAIGTLPAPSLNAEPLFDEDLALWLPPSHRLGAHARVRVSDLDGVAVMCPSPSSALRTLLDDALGRAGIAVRVLAQFDSPEAVFRAAVAANCPAILPAPMLQESLHPGQARGWRAVALTNPRPHRTIALLRRKGRDERAGVRPFVTHLVAVVGELLKME